jgi:hypothetical protein
VSLLNKLKFQLESILDFVGAVGIYYLAGVLVVISALLYVFVIKIK